tara:strand:- start:685 stop:1050 length:366 start_codon:yes stop_codon:yes gene_type:complete
LCEKSDFETRKRFVSFMYILMVVHAVQPIMFYEAKYRPWSWTPPESVDANEEEAALKTYFKHGITLGFSLAYFSFVVTDVLLLIYWFSLSTSECSPFLSNYIMCDFFITFGALINLLYEDR